MRRRRKFISTILLSALIIAQVFGVGGWIEPEKTKAVNDVFYVDDSVGVGNDSNNCTSVETPCATLNGAQLKATANDGDVVHVKYGADGLYAPPAGQFDKAGVTWIGDDENITLDTDSSSYSVYIIGSNVVLDNFIIEDQETQLSSGAFVLKIYGGRTGIQVKNSTIVGVSAIAHGIDIQAGATNVLFESSTISGTFSYAIYHSSAGAVGPVEFNDCDFDIDSATYLLRSSNTSGSGDFTFNSGTIDFTSTSGAVFSIASNINLTVQNFNPVTINDNVPFFSCITGSRTSTINILSNNISYPGTEGVDYVDHIIQFNPASGSSSHNILIDNNSITTGLTNSVDNNSSLMAFRDQTGEIIVSNNILETTTTGSRTHLIFNNVLTESSPSKILISGNTHKSHSPTNYLVLVGTDGVTGSQALSVNKFNNVIIENNKAYGAGYFGDPVDSIHAYLVGHSVNAHFRNNYVNGFGYGMIFKSQGSNYENGGAYGNIFVNNVWTGVLVKGTNNVPIYNNTFYWSENKTTVQGMISIGREETPHASTNTRVRNNVFYATDSGQTFIFVGTEDCAEGFTSDKNIFYNSGSESSFTFVDSVDTRGLSVSEWKSLSGQDGDSQEINPGFSDVSKLLDDLGGYTPGALTSASFTLNATSPAINAGEALQANTDYDGTVAHTDYFNRSIPLFTNPTIGAVEYNQASDSTPPTSSHSISGTANAAGWYNTLPTVTLSAIDNVTYANNTIYAEWGDETPEDTYSSALTATEGTNTLYYKAKDYKNNMEAEVNSIEIKADPTSPTVAVSSPTTGSTTSSSTTTISGTASDATSGLSTLTINSVPVTVTDGSFSTAVSLSLGSNTITLVATDNAGNATTQILTITRTEEAPAGDVTAPTIAMLSPSSAYFSTYNSSFTLWGQITDVGSGVSSAKVSNTKVQLDSNGFFKKSVKLKLGSNQFDIIATDNNGNQTTKTIYITRRVYSPVPIPVSSTTIQDGSSSSNLSTTTATRLNTQTPTLRGKTYPNALVTIEIHSDPITAELTADQNGNWSYTPTEPLAFGDHTVKVTVKDPNTLETISQDEYKITIIEPAKAEKESKSLLPELTPAAASETSPGLIVTILAMLVLGVFLIAYNRKHMHRV